MQDLVISFFYGFLIGGFIIFLIMKIGYDSLYKEIDKLKKQLEEKERGFSKNSNNDDDSDYWKPKNYKPPWEQDTEE